MRILLTGGAGYIGSHLIVQLLQEKDVTNVTVIDNCKNSYLTIFKYILDIVGDKLFEKLCIYFADLANVDDLRRIFIATQPNLVIHCAGVKAVSESVENPLKYYRLNVCNTVGLLEVMQEFKCFQLIFSSSTTVYAPSSEPLREGDPSGPKSPYGRTKKIIEDIFTDLVNQATGQPWHIVSLRYFNPIGAHPSGKLGEYAKAPTNSILPAIVDVVYGKRNALQIFGGECKGTIDGTPGRDYIHIMDLVSAHLAVLRHIQSRSSTNHLQGWHQIWNVGRGELTTVKQLVAATNDILAPSRAGDEKDAADKKTHVPVVMSPPRAGDVEIAWADCSLIARDLKWKAQFTIHDALQHALSWEEYKRKTENCLSELHIKPFLF